MPSNSSPYVDFDRVLGAWFRTRAHTFFSAAKRTRQPYNSKHMCFELYGCLVRFAAEKKVCALVRNHAPSTLSKSTYGLELDGMAQQKYVLLKGRWMQLCIPRSWKGLFYQHSADGNIEMVIVLCKTMTPNIHPDWQRNFLPRSFGALWLWWSVESTSCIWRKFYLALWNWMEMLQDTKIWVPSLWTLIILLCFTLELDSANPCYFYTVNNILSELWFLQPEHIAFWGEPEQGMAWRGEEQPSAWLQLLLLHLHNLTRVGTVWEYMYNLSGLGQSQLSQDSNYNSPSFLQHLLLVCQVGHAIDRHIRHWILYRLLREHDDAILTTPEASPH